MTRLRRAWHRLTGEEARRYEAKLRVQWHLLKAERAERDLAMAAHADAMAENYRTIVTLRGIARRFRLREEEARDERDRARQDAVHLQAERDLVQRSGDRWRRMALRWTDERNEARDERDRARATAVALEHKTARLSAALETETGEVTRTTSALARARTELEVERANAVALTRLLGHTVEHESRRTVCEECHAVDAAVADAQVPS